MSLSQKAYSYIRFSTPDQLKGDSLRRQIEGSRQYAKANGLDLDESFSVRDLGVSAFSGAHKIKGALGTFLKAIEAGKIATGSYLIIESLDRLSREQVLTALSMFTSIIEQGITIVTLSDGMKYSKETLNSNVGQLIISITVMSRAYEESAMKSIRLGAAWKHKRENAESVKLTSICPAWLRLNRKLQIFAPIPERVEIVNRIFQLYLDGNGAYKITRKFNEEGVKPFGRSKGWRTSSVKKILHHRGVLGEMQPHKIFSDSGIRSRVSEGEPLKGYYPQIITEQNFFAVQNQLSTRVGKGGRTGYVHNLFMHLGRCGQCGAKTHYVNKGKWQYLRCDQSKTGRGCNATPWPYPDFESAFLNECRELDVTDILPSKNGRLEKIRSAQTVVDGLKGQLADIEQRLKNYDRAIDTATNDDVIQRFVSKLGDAMVEKSDLEKRLQDAGMSYNAAMAETVDSETQLKSIQALIVKLASTEGQALIDFREKLRNAIAGLVEKVVLFPDGMGDQILEGNFSEYRMASVNKAVEQLENIGPDPEIFQTPEAYEMKLERLKAEATTYVADNTGKSSRAFIIFFKTGGFRIVKAEGKGFISNVSTMSNFMDWVKEIDDDVLETG